MSINVDPAKNSQPRRKGPLELRRKQAAVEMSDQHLLDTKGPGQFVHTDPWRVLRIQSEFVEGFGALADLGPAVSVFGSARTKPGSRSEEHTSELQSRQYLVCRLLLEKKNKTTVANKTVANVVLQA